MWLLWPLTIVVAVVTVDAQMSPAPPQLLAAHTHNPTWKLRSQLEYLQGFYFNTQQLDYMLINNNRGKGSLSRGFANPI